MTDKMISFIFVLKISISDNSWFKRPQRNEFDKRHDY